jgi:hypothetical protein
LRHGNLFDGKNRLPGNAIKNKSKAGFRHLLYGIHQLAIFSDLHEHRLRREIVIPEIMVHGLKMPKALARRRVECNEGIAEETVAFSIAAVGIGRRRSQRKK